MNSVKKGKFKKSHIKKNLKTKSAYLINVN